LLPKAKGRNRHTHTHTHIETAAAAAQLFPGDKIVAIVVQAKKKTGDLNQKSGFLIHLYILLNVNYFFQLTGKKYL